MRDRSDDLTLIRVKVTSKEAGTIVTLLANNGEDHSYQGVLFNQTRTKFGITGATDLGTGNDARYLEYVLDFDVSHWTDVADQKLLESFCKLLPEFTAACNDVDVGAILELTVSRELRTTKTGAVNRWTKKRIYPNASLAPLVYYPLGYESHTCEYTRRLRTKPEVTNVKVLCRGTS